MRKRSRHQPQVKRLPISFGLGADVAKLNSADELALFMLLQGSAEVANLALLEASCASAIHSIDYARAHPETHNLTPECLDAARAPMLQCAAALLAVRGRFREKQALACDEAERETLKDLVDNIKELRSRLTRRVWRVGVQLASDQVAIVVPREMARAHLGAA